jgi:glycosyltransferase involved in cell wall biosynthesis
MPLTILSVSYPLARVAEDTAGGAEQILSLLDHGIVSAGHRSIVIAPEGSQCRGTLIRTALPSGPLNEGSRARAHESCRQAIRSALQRYSVDLVHMHGIDFLEYLPEAGVPVITTLHLPLSWYKSEVFSLTRPDTHLVCVSESQRNLGLPASSKCRVIPNGVRLDRYHPSHEKGNYAIALGRICPEKAFHLALDAASDAGVPLVLAGHVFGYKAHIDYFESELRPRLAGLHQFIGTVGGPRKTQLLAEARCLVVPSLVAETSCLVAMEALACGTPVVAFRRGALAELVEDGCTGFLVDTVSQLAQAILDSKRLSSTICRERARRRFSAEKMIRDYMWLYEEVAHASTPALPQWQEAA